VRVFYYLSGYISHHLAGQEYIACLRRLGHTVSCNYPEEPEDLHGERTPETVSARGGLDFAREPETLRRALEADLLILHEDPAWHGPLYEALPPLRHKPAVACLPWENEEPPQAFLEPLRRAGCIWTCSEFCRRSFLKVFPRVEVLPHVVRRPRAGKEDLAWGRELLEKHGAGGAAIFLSVMDGLNPRKNLPALLTAFSRLRRETRRPVKLLLKQYRAAMPLEQYPDVINITEMLPEGRLAALYILSSAYVSPHHAEGWGLSLSAAMSLGKIVIATGYSGNLEFMNPGNSLLLRFSLAPVPPEMSRAIPLFSPEMRWAQVEIDDLVRAMRLVAEERTAPELRREAARIADLFGPEQISRRLDFLLKRLDSHP
jgi:glycosyltransferase involved in cell wall biosynthesis